MKTLLVLLLGLLPVAYARAQQAELVLPDEIELVPGRLAVTFADGVPESEARAWLGDLGYTIDGVHFGEVVATVLTSEPLAGAMLDALRARDEVVSVDASGTEQGATDAPAAHRFVVHLRPHLSAAEARLVVAETTGLVVDDIRKVPNDIEIQVPEGEEAMEVEALQQHPIVKYVTYVAIPGE